MKTRQTLFVVALSLFVSHGGLGLFAQAAISESSHCFSIRVRLNGEPVDGPTTVSIKTRNGVAKVSLDGNCFPIPAPMPADGTKTGRCAGKRSQTARAPSASAPHRHPRDRNRHHGHPLSSYLLG